uniref:Uncharacterized protein n=1 Tax=Hyaloperonospora arabidopsidis (strain Emoy2) TaxID=559515 RepID=M4B9M3_HYAAE
MRVINDIKQQFTDLVVANLRHDIQLMLIDPVQELKRLYPASTLPVSVEAATVALYVHCAVTRDQCVITAFLRSFWSGTTILRALVTLFIELIKSKVLMRQAPRTRNSSRSRHGGGSDCLFHGYSNYMQDLWHTLGHAVIAGGRSGR